MRPAGDELARYIPDLLNRRPSLSLDRGKVRRALHVAFGTGDAEQSLERIMDEAALCQSSWGGSSFRQGLHMDVLISRCMAVQIGDFRPKINQSYILRLLENPPSDDRDRDFRRSVFAELIEDPQCRQSFEDAYLTMHRLRKELQALDSLGYYDTRVRRLFVLTLIRDLFLDFRDRFAGASSGLQRVSAYAAYVCGTPGFAHLTDLLQYEDGLSNVQFSMRIGSDGTLRDLCIVNVAESRANPFYQGPVRRMLSKFGLWWRGYRVGESGLLDAWLDEVFSGVSAYLPSMFRLLGDQEFYLAGLAFRDGCLARGVATSFPEMLPVGSTDERLKLERLVNPLLFTLSANPVACSVGGACLSSKTLVTGPNSGGKTRFLQAVGITQVLAESGLHAPVASATIPRVNGLFVSLIEEGAVDQTEGRLGMELLRIRKLFETTQVGSLAILDELCSGTNPGEGEKIFLLVLSLLEELGARAVVATHFLDFARGLQAQQSGTDPSLGLAFLQVDVGQDNVPTYQFRPGVARTSMARETAQRLGVSDSLLRALVQRQRAAAGATPAARAVGPAQPVRIRGDAQRACG